MASFQLSEHEYHEAIELMNLCARESEDHEFASLMVERLARRFDLMRCHFVSLAGDGTTLFHEEWGPADILIDYREHENQAILKPRSGHPLRRCRNFTLSARTLQKLSRRLELYDSLTGTHGVHELLASVHPANYAFVGVRASGIALKPSDINIYRTIGQTVISAYAHNRRVGRLESLADLATPLAKSFFVYPYCLFSSKDELVLIADEMKELMDRLGIAERRLRSTFLELAGAERHLPLCSVAAIQGSQTTPESYVKLKFSLERLKYRGGTVHALLLLSPSLPGPFGLTGREMEVATAIQNGLSNVEIAQKLCIAVDTVKKHAANIFRKTESKNRTELLRRLRRSYLSKTPSDEIE